ncbi:hypothetical protein EV421DRAFT_1737162 [Armillaria borealis]|uniref:Uncharacterized protein n=1 Tax=Armillaria borealis TaxID=47425 RepID=A0AA39MNR8_9AGAR|nr:hypothetical protein EV421DRAFT_1737162 [Armillaria borealis]
MQTGHQAIHSPLPPIRGSAPGPYSNTHSSGLSTSTTLPPKTLMYFPGAYGPAQAFAQFLQGLNQLQQSLVQLQLPPTTPETSHNLVTEGDVVRASALYLLHDVNLIIENYFINHLNIQALAIECIGESSDGHSRPDIKYMVGGRAVLIVEFKNINTLDDNDWTRHSLITRDHSPQYLLQRLPPGAQTTLRGNASILVKQAAKYSDTCPLIVLFNYQNMVVLDFRPNGQPFHDVDNPVQYFFSNGQGIPHKKLLLAAFLYGFGKQRIRKLL